jgi:hypothetical protein
MNGLNQLPAMVNGPVIARGYSIETIWSILCAPGRNLVSNPVSLLLTDLTGNRGGYGFMKLPMLTPLSFISAPPLHAWPDPIKQILLTFMVATVLVAYMLLAGGIITFSIMLARWITG